MARKKGNFAIASGRAWPVPRISKQAKGNDGGRLPANLGSGRLTQAL